MRERERQERSPAYLNLAIFFTYLPTYLLGSLKGAPVDRSGYSVQLAYLLACLGRARCPEVQYLQ
jgi:hypothetical protein